MKTTDRRSAFTLIEVLIVVVIMAILAATIIPQFTDSTKDAKSSTVNSTCTRCDRRFSSIARSTTALNPTATLVELTQTTERQRAPRARGATFPFRPLPPRGSGESVHQQQGRQSRSPNDPAVAAT